MWFVCARVRRRIRRSLEPSRRETTINWMRLHTDQLDCKMALPMASSGTASFAGAWRRTLLFEPHNVNVQSDVLVYWLQSACGLFVDLRRPPAALDRGAASFKSFAGTGSATLVGERCHFTWCARGFGRITTAELIAISFTACIN